MGEQQVVRMVSARMVVAGAVVVALLAGAVGAWAGDDGPFPDVPADHAFAEEIGRLAGAGITGGFSDGTFRPGQAVTRQSMAAFLNRGLGRVASGDDLASMGPNGDGVQVVTRPIHMGAPEDQGGATQGTGFVVGLADVVLDTQQDTCPCGFGVRITTSEGISSVRQIVVATTNTTESVSVTYAVPVSSGEGDVVTAAVEVIPNITAAGPERSTAAASLVLLFVPFGYDGGNSLGS